MVLMKSADVKGPTEVSSGKSFNTEVTGVSTSKSN